MNNSFDKMLNEIYIIIKYIGFSISSLVLIIFGYKYIKGNKEKRKKYKKKIMPILFVVIIIILFTITLTTKYYM